MRKIKVETIGCMDGVTNDDQTLTTHFFFPEEFVGFQGHFPGQKILPGVCQIGCVLAVIEQGEGMSAVLREILLAKYVAPVLPGEEVTCTVHRVSGADDEAVFRAHLSIKGKKVTELKLRVALEKRVD